MNSKEIRKKYLEFFKEREHQVIPSASLVPENDSSTLFVGSGMQPLVPYLLGERHPLGKRLTNSQKSFRSEDIEEVGDNRHTTFFEMLGNWSLGDYFKEKQLNWIFEFLTEELNLDPKKFYVTVFRGNEKIGIKRDEESVAIWKSIFEKKGIKASEVDFAEKEGMKEGRIFYYDERENWWSRAGVPENMPVGEPGGPDSEIFYDLGKEHNHHENSPWKNKHCHVSCDCGRFIEIGNSVFMEYIKTENGFETLSQRNVDFGGGLERMTMVVQGKTNVFETDLFIDVLNKIKELSGGKEYRDNEKSFEIIADHIKGAVFLISDGVLPSNTEKGYVLRRLIRRAIRFGKLVDMKKDFLLPLAEETINIYKDVYPKLKESDALLVIKEESENFEKTLEEGLKEFESQIEKIDSEKIPGKVIFDLYQTYGFPLELTRELIKEKGLDLDEEEFKEEFRKHQEISRSEQKFKGGLADNSEQVIKYHTGTHLLLAALRKVLGEHVHQKGSNITADRLRFDFLHGEKMTLEEKEKVEEIVNEKIKEGLKVSSSEMPLKEAKEKGIMGVFDEKYGEKITVYTIYNEETGKVFSREICGGPHVENTSVLGEFKIKKEESSSKGVRRIRAILKNEQ